MAKQIMISDDVYNELKLLKGDSESFSETIKKLTKKKGNTQKIRSMIQELHKKGENKVEIDLEEIRKNWKWNRFA